MSIGIKYKGPPAIKPGSDQKPTELWQKVKRGMLGSKVYTVTMTKTKPKEKIPQSQSTEQASVRGSEMPTFTF